MNLSRLLILAVVLIVSMGTRSSRASYILDGEPSTVGIYAYEVPPPAGTPFVGDVGKRFLSFAEGALMDAQGESLGQNIGFLANERDVQVRNAFVDLGQKVVLESLVVRSRLNKWWGITPFEVAFSPDGASFSNTLKHKGDGLWKVPHEPDLPVNCQLPVEGIETRFLRFRLFVTRYIHDQIGEIDIVADTLSSGAEPLAKINMEALKKAVSEQTEPPVVDEFGQWVKDDWPGKIRGEEELIGRIRAEEARYAHVELDLEKYDRFGGDKTLGTEAEATGKWRLEKIDDRWWFITPEGNPFLMVAVDGFNVWGVNTVEHPDKPGLKEKFAWLPPKDSRFADAWIFSRPDEGIWRFDFFRANVIRCFGEVEEDYWKGLYSLGQRRLLDWGFNSLGKWSEVKKPFLERIGRPLPYILPAQPRPDEGVDIPSYGDFVDPWDTNYGKSVENAVRRVVDEYGDDPYLIGLAFYGEGWWDAKVTEKVLKSIPALPAKRAFVEQLQNTLRDIAVLNRMCAAQWRSFGEMLDVDLSVYTEELKEDISLFIKRSSDRYYRAWRESIDKYDPGRMLLGSCFVIWWRCTPEWVRGSIPHCDAMMIDHYGSSDFIIDEYVEPFAVPADKPVLVGEYGFTTTQRGFLPTGPLGVRDFTTQKERGIAYARFNERLFAHPNWVGSMWFIYRDQVPLGRDMDGGGESHNLGLVDNTNLPYYEMIDVAKGTNRRLFRIHAGKLKPVTRKGPGIE